MSIAACENCDVLLNVFSYLPQQQVLEEACYVNRRWMEAALMKCLFVVCMMGSIIIVDPRIEEENRWRYRTLQAAIDHCKDGSIIAVDVVSDGVSYG